MMEMIESELDPNAGYTLVIDAGDHWMHRLEKCQVLRILISKEIRRWIRCFTTQMIQPTATVRAIPFRDRALPDHRFEVVSQRKTHLLTITADTADAMTPWEEHAPEKATRCAIPR